MENNHYPVYKGRMHGWSRIRRFLRQLRQFRSARNDNRIYRNSSGPLSTWGFFPRSAMLITRSFLAVGGLERPTSYGFWLMRSQGTHQTTLLCTSTQERLEAQANSPTEPFRFLPAV